MKAFGQLIMLIDDVKLEGMVKGLEDFEPNRKNLNSCI